VQTSIGSCTYMYVSMDVYDGEDGSTLVLTRMYIPYVFTCMGHTRSGVVISVRPHVVQRR
jgi:hypothetical protein